MNDSQLTELLRRAERDAPLPDREHAMMRDEVLAHFDHLRGVVGSESESARPADELNAPAEVGGPEAVEPSPGRRAAPLVAAAAAVVLGVASFVVWASAGGDGSDRLVPADDPPVAADVPSAPYGPEGATSSYEVARDGVAQGTLELTVEDNDMPDTARQVTTLSARLTPPGDDGSTTLGLVSFEITDETWSIPVSLGRLSGTDWPDCGDTAVAVPRVAPERSVQTLVCDGMPVRATATTERRGDRLDALISLQTADDEYEMRAVAGADGRLEQMVIELSTTVDLIDAE